MPPHCRGADPSAKMDKKGWTPVHAAAKHKNHEMIQILTDYGREGHLLREKVGANC